LLSEEGFVVNGVVQDLKLVPGTADTALVAVSPVVSLLQGLIAQHTGEDDCSHVASHRVFIQQLVRNLVNSHEHQRQLALRPILLFLDKLSFSLLSLPFYSELLLLSEGVVHWIDWFLRIWSCSFSDSCIDVIA